MVTRTKARILGSFQTRKLTGNNGNVRHNGMEKDGLVALRDENVVSFSSNKEGWGFTLDGGVFPLSGIKAEVFLLLFNRWLGPFWDEKIVKKQNPIRSFITGQEPMNRPVCPDVSFFD